MCLWNSPHSTEEFIRKRGNKGCVKEWRERGRLMERGKWSSGRSNREREKEVEGEG